jgi:HD-like signal output (HDOD) protein
MTTAVARTKTLDEVLEGAQLPALPQSAIRLLELSQDPENGPGEFARPIEADPGLTSQVLKFVNSSYFGFSREISNVKLAITMVGVRTIKNFALWSAVFSLMPNPKCGPFDLKTMWQDSLRRGLFARSLAKIFGMKEAEEQFAAALLQDMAIPLLAKELHTQYIELLSRRDGGRMQLSQLERETFGWTHAEAGARMARQWNLPEEFARLIEGHNEIDSLLTAAPLRHDQLSVALSSLLPPGCDPGWVELERFEAAYQKLRPANGPTLTELLATADKDFAEFAPVLKIAKPGKTLIEVYQEATAPTAAVAG